MDKYDEYIGNYNIFDCVVSKKLIGVLTREKDKPLSEIKFNKFVILRINADSEESRYNAFYNLQDFPNMKGCVAPHPNNPGFVLTSSDAQVFFKGVIEDSEVSDFEDDITKDNIRINNIKFISGNSYAVTAMREVFRRDDINQWTNISKEICEDKKLRERNYEMGGFNDIDGFSSNDIYAAGDDGDCWHYDGHKWANIDLPINTDIGTVCCADDGYVYLGGSMETIVKGKKDKWEIVQSKQSNYSIRKIVNFKNEIYISSVNGLSILSDEKLLRIPYIEDCNYLSTDENQTHLITGDSTDIFIFNGEIWKEVISKDL